MREFKFLKLVQTFSSIKWFNNLQETVNLLFFKKVENRNKEEVLNCQHH